jgi:hypothetical protein
LFLAIIFIIWFRCIDTVVSKKHQNNNKKSKWIDSKFQNKGARERARTAGTADGIRSAKVVG